MKSSDNNDSANEEDLCEGELEHEIVDCPNCLYQFCSNCGKGENDD